MQNDECRTMNERRHSSFCIHRSAIVFFPKELPDMSKYEWLLYVGLAGLAWGTYVPIIFYGGSELSAKPGASGRFMAILCVGAAYFVMGVLLPLLMFFTGWGGVSWENVHLGSSGLIFAS